LAIRVIVPCYYYGNLLIYARGAQPFWATGRIALFLVHLRAEDTIIRWTFESRI